MYDKREIPCFVKKNFSGLMLILQMKRFCFFPGWASGERERAKREEREEPKF